MSSLHLEGLRLTGGFWLAAMVFTLIAIGAQAEGLRPAVAAALQAAEHDLAKHEYAAALKKVAQADAVPDKTAAESLTIGEVKAALDTQSGNSGAAAADYAAIIAVGQLPPDQARLMAQAEASSAYKAGNYAEAIATIQAYLVGDVRFTPILLQSYEKLGQCGSLDKAVMKTAAPPAETDLQLAAYCYGTAKDTAGYLGVIETLVQYYPTASYWGILLAQKQADPAFSDRLALDFFRLKLAVGVPAGETDYMDMAQAAVQSGLPNEAARIMAQGFSAGILGNGPDAGREARLKALVAARQKAAAGMAGQTAVTAGDQPMLFASGLNDVDGGNAATGLPLMETAIRSGGMTQVAQAELEMGIAFREAGQEANARAMWNAVPGGGGGAELARLWMYVR